MLNYAQASIIPSAEFSITVNSAFFNDADNTSAYVVTIDEVTTTIVVAGSEVVLFGNGDCIEYDEDTHSEILAACIPASIMGAVQYSDGTREFSISLNGCSIILDQYQRETVMSYGTAPRAFEV